MPRTIEIAVPAAERDRLLARLQYCRGVAGLVVLPGASVRPAGDLVRLQVTNDGAQEVLKVLGKWDAPPQSWVSVVEPTALVVPAREGGIFGEGNEAAWEEMGALLRSNTNLTTNYLFLMALAGGIAAAGLLTDTLHIVVGAMLLTPGFEPMVRIVFGLLGMQSASARAGIKSTVGGYTALAAGAAAITLLFDASGLGQPEDVAQLFWVSYWSSNTWTALIVALLAGVAGGVVVSTRQALFATGAMVALAVVPSAALFGIGLASGDLGLASSAAGRWAVEFGCVVLGSGAVLGLKRHLLHRRDLVG